MLESTIVPAPSQNTGRPGASRRALIVSVVPTSGHIWPTLLTRIIVVEGTVSLRVERSTQLTRSGTGDVPSAVIASFNVP